MSKIRLTGFLALLWVGAQAKPQIVEVAKIWASAPHNAFTDLIRYKERWFCAFREGAGHVSPDGAIRILTSADGDTWKAAARITSTRGDLRDPKLCIAADGRLMLTGVEVGPELEWDRYQTLAWLSPDGRGWSAPVKIGEPNVWLWRLTWYNGRAFGMGYSTRSQQRFLRLYTTKQPEKFQVLVPEILDGGYPNETSLLFRDDGTALCLLRRDAKGEDAMLGTGRPPYRGWTWKGLGVRLGGPHMIRLPDGRIVAAGRLWDGRERTSLCWLDVEEGKLAEFLTLPSGGDTSYPGLVWHNDLLWVSYYSSHEGKASIYVAKVKVPAPRK